MNFISAKEVQEIMNNKGALNEPFFFVVDFDVTNGFICNLDELKANNILLDFDGKNYNSFNHNDHHSLAPKSNFQFNFNPVSKKDYQKSFNIVQDHLHFGNSYLTNLTFQHEISTDLSLQEIFYRSKARYKLLLESCFLVNSPEAFVITEAGKKIYTFPMKGTIDASLQDAEKTIMSDTKESAEHATIVDLLRNDLNQIAQNVRVESYRYIDHIVAHNRSLLQVSSKIAGDIDKNFFKKLGDNFFQLLPAGSVTGAPKKKTVEIIKEAENYSRDFYTGVFGVFDGQDIKTSVMIRFIQNDNGQLFYKSGGGITAYSDMDSEYEELIQKIYVPIH